MEFSIKLKDKVVLLTDFLVASGALCNIRKMIIVLEPDSLIETFGHKMCGLTFVCVSVFWFDRTHLHSGADCGSSGGGFPELGQGVDQ